FRPSQGTQDLYSATPLHCWLVLEPRGQELKKRQLNQSGPEIRCPGFPTKQHLKEWQSKKQKLSLQIRYQGTGALLPGLRSRGTDAEL
ncbi:MAG TPA: hypothetical protein VGS27_06560, partial [Candidatus Sulfotelmatobacter sp.]|nr:hypothetical protein [Candidatus Sulfotelmatobacter sp.]